MAAADGKFQCPKKRFGRTEIQMPVLTCGGMRIQQSWNRGSMPQHEKILQEGQVDPACQANLVATMRASLAHGINHIETAQAYGCSEIQFGKALREVIASGEVKREDIILQTKVSPKRTAAAFREALELSFARLGVDEHLGGYVDLLAFHGINRDHQCDWVCGVDGSGSSADCCMAVINEYRAAGKIRHVGFSTHAMTNVITRAIKTNQFDYVNLHYHFVGSYTASGCGEDTGGNLDAIAAAAAQDMGVFIISGNDKGGKLYKPSAKIVKLCSPELDPIAFNFLWLCQQKDIHTMVIGAARPTDFDAAMAAAPMLGTEEGLAKVAAVEARLQAAVVEAHGEEWAANWFKGLPDCYENPHGTHICNIVWLHLVTKAWGLHEYSCDRYGSFDGNFARWEPGKTFEENTSDWGYMPGNAVNPSVDYTSLLSRSPDPAKALQALQEGHKWFSRRAGSRAVPPDMAADCAPAYDMQPEVPWPEGKPHDKHPGQ